MGEAVSCAARASAVTPGTLKRSASACAASPTEERLPLPATYCHRVG
jgi:hypothetical protein